MCGKHDVRAYVEDMAASCEQIIIFAAGLTDQELMDPDAPTRGAVLHLLTVLGEAAKHVPEPMAQRHPAIAWADISGLRDKIVHYYFGIKEETLVLVVRRDVPALLPQIRSLLAELDAERDR